MKRLQSVLDNSNISHMPKSRLIWKKEPEEEDFKGALAFLSLGMSKARAAKLISKLRRTKPIEYAAKTCCGRAVSRCSLARSSMSTAT